MNDFYFNPGFINNDCMGDFGYDDAHPSSKQR